MLVGLGVDVEWIEDRSRLRGVGRETVGAGGLPVPTRSHRRARRTPTRPHAARRAIGRSGRRSCTGVRIDWTGRGSCRFGTRVCGRILLPRSQPKWLMPARDMHLPRGWRPEPESDELVADAPQDSGKSTKSSIRNGA